MGSKDNKVELLQTAIKQLIDEEKAKTKNSEDSFVAVSGNEDAGAVDDDDAADHRLLSKLLSQLETMKDDDTPPEPNIQNVNLNEVGENIEDSGSTSSDISKDDIVGELKKIRRQNFITHCLLSAMIVLTITWQVSEVSLILKVKDGLSNPFRTLGGLFKGMIMKPQASTDHEEDKQVSSADKQNPLLTTSPLPGLKIPKLPHVELPAFDLDHEDD
ncbi:OLC1v1028606C1 [Oldenlandia corymbosa var. corymbosa]|uniref:OLC1v1028606C1 n=1 Tax=Oldenlandia corymbosa var. corymbosa TaxID=529605 RepID=A0AAV1CDT2_OLDCO|nr:OLC1v1028606C1 [Oldenlandia corymbosa var. corymbosa]